MRADALLMGCQMVGQPLIAQRVRWAMTIDWPPIEKVDHLTHLAKRIDSCTNGSGPLPKLIIFKNLQILGYN